MDEKVLSRLPSTRFHLEARLRFLQVFALVVLDVGVHKEKCAGEKCDDAADDCDDEGPAEEVVEVTGHPAIGVAPEGEDEDGDATADACEEGQVADGRDQADVVFLLRIAAHGVQEDEDEGHHHR